MKREIQQISPDLSAGVQAEAEVLGAMDDAHRLMQEASTAKEYWQSAGSMAPYEYETLLADLPKQSRILDVGVGFGHSSVFLAAQGHKVVAVEPALSLCELISGAAAKFNLDLEVVQGVGEHLSRLDRADFDIVIFNASLHHCDDPVRAIDEAYQCLRPGGLIYLVNEFKLKPWETQRSFYKKLASDPIGMGHYGGNEHAYHNSGYVKMLNTRFRDVQMLPTRPGSALDDLRTILSRRINGDWVYSRSGPVLSRFLFYVLRARVRSISWLYAALARASIVPVHFRGHKGADQARSQP